MPRPLAPLARAPFRWLFLAGTVDRLGGAMAPVALAFAMLDLTGSVTSLGIVLGVRSLANVAFLLVGGVVADRLPRGLVLVGSNVAAALTQGAVAVLVFAEVHSVLAYAALSALNGTVAAFALPATQALIPQTVPPDELAQANALTRLGINASGVVGVSFAGVLVAAAGPGWGIAADAASFALAAALFALVQVPVRAARAAAPSFVRDLAEGWSAFISRTWLWVVVAAFCVINACYAGGLIVLGPAVADETFGRRAWGFVLGAQALGFVAGGLLALRLQPRRLLLFGMICTAVQAVPLAMLGARAPAALLIVGSFVAGAAIEQFGVAWSIAMHRDIPEELMARAWSYDSLGSFIAIPVGEVAAGPVAAAIGVRATLFGAAALTLLAVALSLLSRGVRDLGTEGQRTTSVIAT